MKMHMSLATRWVLGAAGLLGSTAFAMSGNTHLMDWPHRGESLRYTTCGCADSCWTVDLREKRTHRLKMRLQCGCETLKVSWPGKPSEEAGSCTAMNDSPDKFELIVNKVKQLNAR